LIMLLEDSLQLKRIQETKYLDKSNDMLNVIDEEIIVVER